MKKTSQKESKVIPMHFCIEEKDIQQQYDCDRFCLYKAGGFMHYMTKGGYHVFVKPDYSSLYSTLELLLELLIATDGKTGEEKQNAMNVADFISSLLFAPTVIFGDEEIMFKAFEHLQEFAEQLLKKSTENLEKEDFDANNEFESRIKAAEETIEKLKVLADALPEETKNE